MKRIKTGYSVYAGEMRIQLKEKYPNHKRSDISLIIRDMWRKLDANEKIRYVNQAAAVNIAEAQQNKNEDQNYQVRYSKFKLVMQFNA